MRRYTMCIVIAVLSLMLAACSSGTRSAGHIADKPKPAVTQSQLAAKPGKPKSAASAPLQTDISVVRGVYKDLRGIAERCQEHAQDSMCSQFIKDRLSDDQLLSRGLFTPAALGFEFRGSSSLQRDTQGSGKRLDMKLFLPGTNTVGYTATILVMSSTSIKLVDSQLSDDGQQYFVNHPEVTEKWQS